MTDQQFGVLLDKAVPETNNYNIYKYLMITRKKLSLYRRIAVSYSGGSDSDIILDMIQLVKPENSGEIRYVFFDTGLEWDATLRHVAEVEQRYSVTIDIRKAKVSIPVACKRHGIPFISKDVSEKMGYLQSHNFDWNDTPEQATVEKYGKCKSSLDWFFNRRPPGKNNKPRYCIKQYRLLKEYIQQNPPDFRISDKCCDYAKKNVARNFNTEYGTDLSINGMRKSEGGRRIGTVKSCFSTATDSKPYDEYRPLWFWSDADKQAYKQWRGIVYSDCYEKWGFSRTGCIGCPCASNSVPQLELAKAYEPIKVKAAYAVFGKSYEYREKYNQFKQVAGHSTRLTGNTKWFWRETMTDQQRQAIQARCNMASDAELIAHARQDILALLTALDEAHNELLIVAEHLHKAYDKQDQYAHQLDILEADRERYKARTQALERALTGRCWACANAKMWDKHPEHFPNMVICDTCDKPHGGTVKDCANWKFDQQRFSETT